MKVQLASGALFFATAIWGVTDAVLNYQPLVVLEIPQVRPTGLHSASPPPHIHSRDGAARDSARPGGDSSLRLGLTWLGDGLGGSLAFRF